MYEATGLAALSMARLRYCRANSISPSLASKRPQACTQTFQLTASKVIWCHRGSSVYMNPQG
jgi:hypothetical protein